ncbi:hypothetical protein BDQ12DRAFT_684758 [Crucibulum laeve]|uniref:WW domain-containing protein n=1 Tax=Crucibulum laeve TaxID=68775 RepID=A0A5C3LX92_9AGAR|nr:hypothetical protein BDQ12DRAFT_684758 [Crucibulum laeve]
MFESDDSLPSTIKSEQAYHHPLAVSPLQIAQYQEPQTTNLHIQKHIEFKLSRGPHVYPEESVEGWKEFTHPNGKLYYWNQQLRIVTEENIKIRDDKIALNDLFKQLTALDPTNPLPVQGEIYLGLRPARYYVVDHGRKQVWWWTDVDSIHVGGKHIGRNGTSNIFILQNYYRHLENFPSLTPISKEDLQTLRDGLIFSGTDRLSSQNSTAPWNATDAKMYLDFMKELEEGATKETGLNNVDKPSTMHQTWFASRLMCIMLQSRSMYGFGTKDAIFDYTIIIQLPPKVFIDYLVGIFSFFAPSTYMQRLHHVRAGGVTSFTRWQALVTSLLAEWSDSNLLATVVLSSNMAFLALNNLSAIGRISSLISTFFSISSIITGLHHVRTHRDRKDLPANKAAMYFRNSGGSNRNFRRLSFFLGLPLIFLSWSLVAFACAVTTYAFQNEQSLASYAILGSILGVLVVVMIWMLVHFYRVFSVGHKKTQISNELVSIAIHRQSTEAESIRAEEKGGGREIRERTVRGTTPPIQRRRSQLPTNEANRSSISQRSSLSSSPIPYSRGLSSDSESDKESGPRPGFYSGRRIIVDEDDSPDDVDDEWTTATNSVAGST